MAKRRMVKYMLKRSQKFVISGYTVGNPFDALIVGCYDGRDLKYVGTVRNGLVPHIRCALGPGCGNSRRRNVRLLIFPRSGERFIRLPVPSIMHLA